MTLTLAISIGIVFGTLAVTRFAIEKKRARRRLQATQVPANLVVKAARGVTARVFVDQDILDGPKANVINNTPADLVLTDDRLIVATRHGRVLEVSSGAGSVRCTGPRRLVIEGERLRKNGPMKVRIEALVDDAEGWAASARFAS